MEIITERLEREFGLEIITTSPSVSYKVYKTDGNMIEVSNPSSLPPVTEIKQIEEPLPSIRKIRNDVSNKVEKIIYKACQKNPDNRYQSMKSFKHDLQTAMSVDSQASSGGFFSKLFKRKKKNA